MPEVPSAREVKGPDCTHRCHDSRCRPQKYTSRSGHACAVNHDEQVMIAFGEPFNRL
jgi:hypothetical protein